MKTETNPGRSSFSLKSLLISMGIFLFVTFTISASITSLNQLLARLVLCPSATSYEFQDQNGGNVSKVGTASDVATTISSLRCEFADGSIRKIDNDRIVITGFITAASIGAVLGALLYIFKFRMM